MKRQSCGFTLIELMVVMAIIGILSAISYPAYTKHVLKSNRTAAKAQMMDLANRQQQYLLANRRYATKTEMTASGFSPPSEVSTKYDWDVATNLTTSPTTTVPAFTATFTAKSTQLSDGNLTLNSDGTKLPTDKW